MQVARVLNDFSRHTRMLGEAKDANYVASRYLAAHLSVVPAESAFAMLGSDYSAMVNRTHKPPLSNYAKQGNVDAETFVSIVKDGFSDGIDLKRAAIEAPSYARFCKEYFDKAERKTWKPVASYLAANYAKNKAVLEKIMIQVEPNNTKLREQVCQYGKTIKYGPTGAQDIGNVISWICLPVAWNVHLKTPTEDQDEPVMLKSSAPSIEHSLVILDKCAPPTMDMDQLRPLMEPYRIRANLPASISHERLAKQMLLAAIDENAPRAYIGTALGRHQQGLCPLKGQDERTLVCAIIDALPTIPDFCPTESAHCQALSDATMCNEWEPRSLLKHIVDPGAFMEAKELYRYQKTPIKQDGALVQALAVQ